MKYFPGDIYLNSIMSSVADISSYAFGALIFEKIGFKSSVSYLLLSSAVGGFFILLFGFEQNLPFWVFPFLVMVSKFGVSAVFMMIYIANANYFPT